MAKRIVTKIGNVFCAEFEDFKCYFQYIANDLTQLNSSVIRVFRRHYPLDYNPVIDDIVKDDIQFYAHTILRRGIELGGWYKVGKSAEIGEAELSEVVFGYTIDHTFINLKINEVDPLTNWHIWHVNGEFTCVGKLPEKYHSVLELGDVFHFESIRFRMKYGYYLSFSIEYEILKRVPLPDADSFMKIEDESSKTVTYYHFHGDRVVRQIVVMPGEKIRLTEQEPKSGKYRLFKGRFGDINRNYKQFRTKDEFEYEWNATCTDTESSEQKKQWPRLGEIFFSKDD